MRWIDRIRSLAAISFLVAAPVAADVRYDGSFGQNGSPQVDVSGGGRDYLIEPGHGATRGANLFHSFERLDLEAGENAVFLGDGALIDSILARVTGGPSSIDGGIVSRVAGADVFLINPSGIRFGPNASLDVGGAFFASTAHELRLTDGAVFPATLGAAPILSAAPPESFGFLEAPAGIEVDGSVLVGAPGAAMALIGGPLDLSGALPLDATDPTREIPRGVFASIAGPMDLVGAGSAGRVTLTADGIELSGFGPRADVMIRDGMTVSSSALSPDRPLSFPDRSLGSGAIRIQGRDVLVEGAQVRSLTLNGERGGDVTIDASGDLLVRTGSSPTDASISSASGLVDAGEEARASINPVQQISRQLGADHLVFRCDGRPCGAVYGNSGDAGDIVIRAASIRLLDGGQLSASSDFLGRAGSVDLRATTGPVEISGTSSGGVRSGVFSNARGTGAPGEISVAASRVEVRDLGVIVTQNSGPHPDARRVARSLGGSLEKSPETASVRIDADVVELLAGGRVDSSTRSDGPGGRIEVRARELVRISGSSGRSAEELARIELDSDGDFSGITSKAQPEAGARGGGGSVRVAAPRIEIGPGGRISSESLGDADAGDVVVDGASEILLQAGDITAASATADGGNVTLEATQRIELRDGSGISASVSDGQGGNVLIDPRFVILDGSRIVAQAGAGTGGRIEIVADFFIASDDSVVDASATGGGVDGTVVIRSPDVEIGKALARLPGGFDAGSLLRAACADGGPRADSFVVLGPQGIPPEPGGLVPARGSDVTRERLAAAWSATCARLEGGR